MWTVSAVCKGVWKHAGNVQVSIGERRLICQFRGKLTQVVTGEAIGTAIDERMHVASSAGARLYPRWDGTYRASAGFSIRPSYLKVDSGMSNTHSAGGNFLFLACCTDKCLWHGYLIVSAYQRITTISIDDGANKSAISPWVGVRK